MIISIQKRKKKEMKFNILSKRLSSFCTEKEKKKKKDVKCEINKIIVYIVTITVHICNTQN